MIKVELGGEILMIVLIDLEFEYVDKIPKHLEGSSKMLDLKRTAGE